MDSPFDIYGQPAFDVDILEKRINILKNKRPINIKLLGHFEWEFQRT